MKKAVIIANYENNDNLRCYMRRIGNLSTHVHDLFEIGMILEGRCSLTVGDETCSLKEDDIFSIESREPHSLLGNDCTLITVQFSQLFFERMLPEPKHPDFSCNSALHGNNPAYEELRRLVARLIWNNTYKQTGFELRNMSLIFEIMDVMYQNFRIEDSEARNRKAHRYTARMMEISSIINENYQNNLTLSELAEKVHLSGPYLSKFFERQFGTTFLNYLARVRLNHAINELLRTSDTIEMISANAGFPNSSAFVKAFKKEYGVLPSIYRRREQNKPVPQEQQMVIEQHDYMARLKKYLETPAPVSHQTGSSSFITIDYNQNTGTLHHTWKNMLGVSHASSLLLSDIRSILERTQKEIGLKWIKFNGIFSDDMHVYSLKADGTPSYSFSYVDRALDFLLSIHLRPFIHLGFMPRALAKENRHVFDYVISAPESNNRWCELVEAFIHHIQERYGRSEIRQWLFCVWDSPGTLYRFSDDETFYQFYRDTRSTVKNCDPELRFGSPGAFFETQSDNENWYYPFLRWCNANDCLPDFLNIHYYDIVAADEESGQKAFGFPKPMILRDTPEGFSAFVRQIRQFCRHTNMEDQSIFLSEWNNTPSQQDLLNDTCFRSCYLTKNLLENYDQLDSFAIWSLTDWMGESPLPKEMYFGGLGLFTSNGIPKAGYYALTLLNQLGDTLIGKGDGWFITKQGDELRIILYHYRHFSHLYAQGERFDMTFSERYTPFGPEQLMDVHLTINNIPDREYQISETIVSRKSGSSFDQWVNMGAVELHHSNEYEMLASLSVQGLNKYSAVAKNGSLQIDAMLDMLEVRLIQIQ